MKLQSRHSVCWARVSFRVLVLMASMLNCGVAEAQTRKFIDPRSEYGKLVGVVTQLDGTGGMGNGFVFGPNGCYVISNVHVAFGASRNPDGTTVLMDVSTGHVLRFIYDFDSKGKAFKQEQKATVLDYGNYDPSTPRGRTQDVAVLKLERCLGPAYDLLKIDENAESKRFPEGQLLSVSYSKLNGEFGVVAENCSAAQSTPITGLIITSCFSEAGMSGSMILEASGLRGEYRLVGIHQGQETMADGRHVPVAVYARTFKKIIDSALSRR